MGLSFLCRSRSNHSAMSEPVVLTKWYAMTPPGKAPVSTTRRSSLPLAEPGIFRPNEYMLESFLISYSKKFVLLNNGQSLHNVAGAIVKKDGKIKEFEDACAAVLSESRIELKKSEALNYLADVNMITRRSYKDLDTAMRKATQIRNRKE